MPLDIELLMRLWQNPVPPFSLVCCVMSVHVLCTISDKAKVIYPLGDIANVVSALSAPLQVALIEAADCHGD